MTRFRRVIVCLDADDDRVVKGVQFRALRPIGDPADMAARYERAGADEIVLLDISASADGRETRWDTVRRTAEQVFIPLTFGGGVRSVDDVGRALRAGADKVAVNTAAVTRPVVINEASAWFGAQCIVASIDAKRDESAPSGWRVVINGGRTETSRDVAEWARECVDRGAGEILLTSIDCDGSRTGYELALTRAVASLVTVPVVASGGAGSADHVCAVLCDGGADAALVAGIVHDGVVSVESIKTAMAARGLPVRGDFARGAA
jgi:imidazole glycerol-phosphate synthase subunit HisF